MTNFINNFLEKNAIDSLSTLLTSSDENELTKSSAVIAKSFGTDTQFDSASENETKLLTSFKKNLTLLIQKTWVEEFDISLKEQVLYKLDQYVTAAEEKKWNSSYNTFIQIIDDVTYLMFGTQSKSDEFTNYALRIDPEFGIFCWFVKSLPAKNDWSEEKNRIVQLLGIFFLANF